MGQQRHPNRLRGLNEFLTSISANGEPVAEQQPQEERKQTEQYGAKVQGGLMPRIA